MFKNLDPSLRKAMYVVLAAFLCLVGATFYTIRLTYQQYEPVMDKDYYEIGLNYEKTIRDQKELMSAGYRLDLNWGANADILPKENLILQVSLLQNESKVPSEEVKLILERNATVSKTLRLVLNEKETGVFSAKLPDLDPGTWNTRVIAKIENRYFEKQGQIIVR
ncbi:hypothetical protein LPTSP4_34140 [Leptospira ryugenii]|uniref:FixH family protein n=1 Tax=Leptospira ryugenii TaxID=1917863 RepID=A0A2P2E4T9_9LEPT|nr:FixH family protein [Leptospira ryugenii]GBF51876.1 hypothetical protein LPTSP4_34140 [Leptospira ryugenii]